MAIGQKTQQILEILSKALGDAYDTIARLTTTSKNNDAALAEARSELTSIKEQLANVDDSVADTFSGVFTKANDLLDQINQLDPVTPVPTPVEPTPVEPTPDPLPTTPPVEEPVPPVLPGDPDPGIPPLPIPIEPTEPTSPES